MLHVLSSTETCDQCVAQRLQMEEEQKFSFDQATIFVRKVLPDAVSSLNSLDSESTKDDDDPDFQEVATGFCHTHTQSGDNTDRKLKEFNTFSCLSILLILCGPSASSL